MSRSLIPLLFILAPGAVQAQADIYDERVKALMTNAQRLVAVDADGCLINEDPDEIVVCAAFDPNRKYRLPFPELASEEGARKREPIPSGNPEIVQQGRCYITYTERNCFKGVPIMSIAFGGSGGGVNGPAGRLWRVITPSIPDEDYVKQVQIRANEDK